MSAEEKTELDLLFETFPFEGNLEHKVHTWEELDIYNESSVCHIVLDFSGAEEMQVWANSAYLDAIGKTLEEYRQHKYSQCSASLKQALAHYYQQIQVQKQTARWTHTTYPDGKDPIRFYMVQRPFLLEVNGETKALIFNDMIPVCKNDADSFRPLEELLRYTNVGQLMVDANTLEVVTGNPAAQFSYKCKKDFTRLAGGAKLKMEDIFASCAWESEERRKAVWEQVQGLTLQSDPVEVEVQKKQAEDEEWRHVRDQDTPAENIKYSSGGAQGVVAHKLVIFPAVNPATGRSSLMLTEYDISELKQTQADLEEANRLQDLAFASISHELRAPLNGIVGLSDALLASATTPSAQKMLQVIRAQGLRLAGLVNDILDAASFKRSTLVLGPGPTDLFEAVEAICLLLRPLLKPSVRLVNDIAPGSLPQVDADPDRIMQVLTNLVSNAIKFTESGSVTVRGRLEGASVRVEVADTGRGIPPHKVDAVWGAFAQESARTARRFGGTGLGLSLVKALVEAHGGSCSVASRYRQVPSGATFAFTLPLRRREGGGLRTPSSGSSVGDRRMSLGSAEEEGGGRYPSGGHHEHGHGSAAAKAAKMLAAWGEGGGQNGEPAGAEAVEGAHGGGVQGRGDGGGGEAGGPEGGGGGGRQEAVGREVQGLEAELARLKEEVEGQRRELRRVEAMLGEAQRRRREGEARERKLAGPLQGLVALLKEAEAGAGEEASRLAEEVRRSGEEVLRALEEGGSVRHKGVGTDEGEGAHEVGCRRAPATARAQAFKLEVTGSEPGHENAEVHPPARRAVSTAGESGIPARAAAPAQAAALGLGAEVGAGAACQCVPTLLFPGWEDGFELTPVQARQCSCDSVGAQHMHRSQP